MPEIKIAYFKSLAVFSLQSLEWFIPYNMILLKKIWWLCILSNMIRSRWNVGF